MENVLEIASSSASEATRILSRTAQEIVATTKETLWNYYESNSGSIEKDLNSSYEKEKLSAMRKLLALMGKGEDCKIYFASVIKNVAFNSFLVKKLVYIYLLRYAEEEPDLSLLSINQFQKDLSDPNPMIRTVALRVLCSIKVPLIIPIIANAFKKGVSDMSPYVRKAVAISLVKSHRMDPEQPVLIEIIETLLNDKSTIVLGPIISSLNLIAPNRMDLLHKHFTKICKLLQEVDEWGQIQILLAMDRYCRLHFIDPETIGANTDLDKDHQMFLDSCRPLLFSRNPLVVLTVSRIYYEHHQSKLKDVAARSLIRCLIKPKHEQQLIFVAIKALVIKDPIPWFKFLSYFAIFPSEMADTKLLKLDILELLAKDDNINWILSELKLALASIKTWRAIVTKIPAIIQPTLESLISLLSHSNDAIVGESIITIRYLLSSNNENDIKISHEKLLPYLVSIYTSITVPLARASILWLLGRHLESFRHAPDALRIALKSFSKEHSVVKKQIIKLATLLILHCDISASFYNFAAVEFIKEAFAYTLKLGKLDVEFDVRDQSRLLDSFFSQLDPALYPRLFSILSEVARVIVAPPPKGDSNSNVDSGYRVESLSYLLQKEISGYSPNPNWSLELKCASERKETGSDQNWGRECVSVNELKPAKRETTSKQRVISLEEFYSDISSSAGPLSPSSSAGLTPSNLTLKKQKEYSSDSFYSESDSEFGSD